MSLTQEERNRRQRLSRLGNGNKHTLKYEKTLKGKLVRTYRNMKSRVEGILKPKSHLYEGLPILSKEDFYDWSLSDESYLSLHRDWVDSGYEKKLSPSIDRKDSSLGYVVGNIRWLTHSENSRLGSKNRNVK